MTYHRTSECSFLSRMGFGIDVLITMLAISPPPRSPPPSAQLAWPTWMSRILFPAASLATLNLDVGGLTCVGLPFGSWGPWLFTVLLPVAVVAALLIVTALTAVAAALTSLPCCTKRSTALAEAAQALARYPLHIRRWLWRLSSCDAALAFLSVVYVFAVRSSLEPLRCVTVLGKSVLASNTSVSCTDSDYQLRKTVAVAAAVGYGVGVPLLLLVVLAAVR